MDIMSQGSLAYRTFIFFDDYIVCKLLEDNLEIIISATYILYGEW